ncbi:MAG: TetR family transcriptional regulator [Actinomycetota bacterium]
MGAGADDVRARTGHKEQQRSRAKPGPVRRLSRDLIVDAVLEVGLDHLTMARVADHLGVAPGGLYRYVEDRDDLIAATADRLISSVPYSDADNWIDVLRDEAWARFTPAVDHLAVVREIRASKRPSRAAGARYRWCMDRMVELGLSSEDALLAVDSIVDVVDDGMQQMEAVAKRIAELGIDGFADQMFEPGGPHSEAIRAVALDLRSFLERKVEVVLAGLEATVRPRQVR